MYSFESIPVDDHCRVVLKSPDEEEIDYINASYIHVRHQGVVCDRESLWVQTGCVLAV